MLRFTRFLFHSLPSSFLKTPVPTFTPLTFSNRFFFAMSIDKIVKMIEKEKYQKNLDRICVEIAHLKKKQERSAAVEAILEKMFSKQFSPAIVLHPKYSIYLKNYPDLFHQAYYYRIMDALQHLYVFIQKQDKKGIDVAVKEIQASIEICFDNLSNLEEKHSPQSKYIDLMKCSANFNLNYLSEIAPQEKKMELLIKGRDLYVEAINAEEVLEEDEENEKGHQAEEEALEECFDEEEKEEKEVKNKQQTKQQPKQLRNEDYLSSQHMKFKEKMIKQGQLEQLQKDELEEQSEDARLDINHSTLPQEQIQQQKQRQREFYLFEKVESLAESVVQLLHAEQKIAAFKKSQDPNATESTIEDMNIFDLPPECFQYESLVTKSLQFYEQFPNLIHSSDHYHYLRKRFIELKQAMRIQEQKNIKNPEEANKFEKQSLKKVYQEQEELSALTYEHYKQRLLEQDEDDRNAQQIAQFAVFVLITKVPLFEVKYKNEEQKFMAFVKVANKLVSLIEDRPFRKMVANELIEQSKKAFDLDFSGFIENTPVGHRRKRNISRSNIQE